MSHLKRCFVSDHDAKICFTSGYFYLFISRSIQTTAENNANITHLTFLNVLTDYNFFFFFINQRQRTFSQV